MIVECPHCHTRFRLDPAQLQEGRSLLKCTRCRRIFPPPAPAPAVRRPPKKPREDKNLSFAFDDDDDDWQAPALTSNSGRVAEERSALNASSTSLGAPVSPPAPPPLSWAGDDEVDLVRDEEGSLLEEADEEEDDQPMRARGGIGLPSVFVFLVLVVSAYGALTWTLLDDPDWTTRLVRALPIIGKEIRERTGGEDVALSDLWGRYERTKEGKLVLVITGNAVNQAGESLRGVQVLCRLFAGSERPLDEQIVSCGTPMEAKIGDLSVHQVAILRGIKPPTDLSVQPGGRCPFAALFFDVPETASGFSTEVARAQRKA